MSPAPSDLVSSLVSLRSGLRPRLLRPCFLETSSLKTYVLRFLLTLSPLKMSCEDSYWFTWLFLQSHVSHCGSGPKPSRGLSVVWDPGHTGKFCVPRCNGTLQFRKATVVPWSNSRGTDGTVCPRSFYSLRAPYCDPNTV